MLFRSTWFVKEYDAQQRANSGTAVTNWKAIPNGTDSLDAFKGYIFGLKTGVGTIKVSFKLKKSIVENETIQPISVSYYTGAAGITNYGWNLIGQPYLSKYATQSGTNMLNLYKHNGTTYEFYARNTFDLPVLDPFTAYFTQVDNSFSQVNFLLTARQFAPASVAVSQSDLVRIHLSTATGTDKTNLIMDDLQSTSYQIGQDLAKMTTLDTNVPQVYTVLGNVNYANNALPLNSVTDLPLAFYTKTAGTSTIHVDATQAKDLSELLLTDTQTGATTNLLQTDYSFTATAGTTTNRLVLNARKVVTDKPEINNHEGEPQVIINNSKILINKDRKSTRLNSSH